MPFPPSLAQLRTFGVVTCLPFAVSSLLSACSSSEPASASAPSSMGGASSVGGAADAGFPVSPFLTFDTAEGDLHIELRMSPFQPPQVGPAEAELRITDAASSAPVPGLTLAVTTWMPVMKHAGSALKSRTIDEGNGIYRVTPLAFAMPGKGEFKIAISGDRTGSAVSPEFDLTE